MPRTTNADRDEAITYLRAKLKPGDALHTTVTNVARSGMSRTIRVFLIRDGEAQDISGYVANAVGFSRDHKRGGLRLAGCGMDMGFEAVYQLSSVLFPKGFRCAGKRCPSNDHHNGDRNRHPHHHDSPGYALRQAWL